MTITIFKNDNNDIQLQIITPTNIIVNYYYNSEGTPIGAIVAPVQIMSSTFA